MLEPIRDTAPAELENPFRCESCDLTYEEPRLVLDAGMTICIWCASVDQPPEADGMRTCDVCDRRLPESFVFRGIVPGGGDTQQCVGCVARAHREYRTGNRRLR